LPRKLSPGEIGELLDQARAELGLHGEVHQVFDGVEWRGRSSLGASILTLGPRGDGTRIALTTERIDQAVAIGAGSVGIGFLAALGGVRDRRHRRERARPLAQHRRTLATPHTVHRWGTRRKSCSIEFAGKRGSLDPGSSLTYTVGRTDQRELI
jgi:hypothetical protein